MKSTATSAAAATARPQQAPVLFPDPPPAPDLRAGNAPPSDTPFPYRDYALAGARLLTALRRGSFYGLVTGVSGTGKTALARDFMAGLDRHRHHFIYVSSSLVTVIGIARFLSKSLLITPRRSHLETVQSLADAMRANPAHVVLWVDDADQVTKEALAEIRVIAECAIDVTQLFSVVLCGLPALRAAMDVHELFPLKRRLSVRCALEGLLREELEAFLVHRFGAADAKRVPSSLHDELFERSQASPGVLLRVVGDALEASGSTACLGDEDLRKAFDAVGL